MPLLQNNLPKIQIPLYLNPVHAGIPMIADDFIEKTLDFNELLAPHPSSIFCVRAKGNSMINMGIYDDDILIIDKDVYPKNGNIVIACIDNEFTVKTYYKKGSSIILKPANPNLSPIIVEQSSNFQIYGIVKSVIHILDEE